MYVYKATFPVWFWIVLINNGLFLSFQNHMDPFEELGITEQNAEKHRRSATEKQVHKRCGVIISGSNEDVLVAHFVQEMCLE